MGEWVTNIASQELTKTGRWDMRPQHILTLQLIHQGRYYPEEPFQCPHICFSLPLEIYRCELSLMHTQCRLHLPHQILCPLPFHQLFLLFSFPPLACLCLQSCCDGSFFIYLIIIPASIYWGCIFFFISKIQNSWSSESQWIHVVQIKRCICTVLRRMSNNRHHRRPAQMCEKEISGSLPLGLDLSVGHHQTI